MKEKLKDYIHYLEKEDTIDTSLLLTRIQFYQHERLVHFLVTFFVGLCCVLFLLGFLFLENVFLCILFLLTMCLFIPYIFYYYSLENGVQKLYDIYINEMKKKK
ncbi:MAG: hypothetical protein IJG68_04265 [Bacilli bacterium]|nr:hypothetical protein [Bacilli bacterium]